MFINILCLCFILKKNFKSITIQNQYASFLFFFFFLIYSTLNLRKVKVVMCAHSALIGCPFLIRPNPSPHSPWQMSDQVILLLVKTTQSFSHLKLHFWPASSLLQLPEILVTSTDLLVCLLNWMEVFKIIVQVHVCHWNVISLRDLLVVQFQQVGNSLVLLLCKLKDAHWTHPRIYGTCSPGEAAKVTGGVWSTSEWIRMVWWGQASGHDGPWSVQMGAIKNLIEWHDIF